MNKYHELYKHNGLEGKSIIKREISWRNRKEKRSLAFDKFRHVAFEECDDLKSPKVRNYKKDFIKEKARQRVQMKSVGNKVSTMTEEKVKPPFIVGIVRHKIHSPPFLHEPVKSSKTNLATIKSFAPKNYKFRAPPGLKEIKNFTPMIERKQSPFSLKSLRSHSEADKKNIPNFTNITIGSKNPDLPFTDIRDINKRIDRKSCEHLKKKLFVEEKQKNNFDYCKEDYNKENICPNSDQTRKSSFNYTIKHKDSMGFMNKSQTFKQQTSYFLKDCTDFNLNSDKKISNESIMSICKAGFSCTNTLIEDETVPSQLFHTFIFDDTKTDDGVITQSISKEIGKENHTLNHSETNTSVKSMETEGRGEAKDNSELPISVKNSFTCEELDKNLILSPLKEKDTYVSSQEKEAEGSGESSILVQNSSISEKSVSTLIVFATNRTDKNHSNFVNVNKPLNLEEKESKKVKNDSVTKIIEQKKTDVNGKSFTKIKNIEVIDLVDSPKIKGEQEETCIMNKSTLNNDEAVFSPIMSCVKKSTINNKSSESESCVINLVSDDEDEKEDYTQFLSRVLNTHVLKKFGSPYLNVSRTPLSSIQNTLAVHDSPYSVYSITVPKKSSSVINVQSSLAQTTKHVIQKEMSPKENVMSSPKRVLNLRSRTVITPSQITPRRRNE